MSNFMRNHRDKGYPDSDHGKDESSSSSSSTLTRISETPPQHSASSSAMTLSRPSGYPHTNYQPGAWINQGTHNDSLVRPQTAQRRAAHQEARDNSGGSRRTIIIGHNQNEGSRQNIGEVSLFNRAAGSESASPFPTPENMNVGHNINRGGGDQEIGGVKFGNVG